MIEKAESLQAEHLFAVRSSKALRLKRINILVLGKKGAPRLAHMRWWTTRGDEKSAKRDEEKEVLAEIDQRWGKEVIHLWDRGFAGNPWLTQAFIHGARFILRWPKNYQLLNEEGEKRKPGQISKGKRSWEH